MKVADMGKTFLVSGKRHWEAGATGIYPSEAEAFTYQPISYDLAFGGIDNFLADEKHHVPYMLNPVGRGYHKHLNSNLVDGTPMPHTEQVNHRIDKPHDNYQPMAFGPVGRGWEPRSQYAGTYDEAWLDDQFPFLPGDFDNRYFQGAPLDQQIAYPQGGEEVILINLTPGGGRVRFQLPQVDMPVVFFHKKGEKYQTHAVIDTIVFEPDKWLFTMTWRTSMPLKKSIFEIPQILVGHMSRGWWRARELGKTWYPSLAHLERANRQAAEENT